MMVLKINSNDENTVSTLLINIGWRKENKRNFLNLIIEIKYFMYNNGDSLGEAYKKFSNQNFNLLLNDIYRVGLIIKKHS